LKVLKRTDERFRSENAADFPLLTSFEPVFKLSTRGKAESHSHTWFCKATAIYVIGATFTGQLTDLKTLILKILVVCLSIAGRFQAPVVQSIG